MKKNVCLLIGGIILMVSSASFADEVSQGLKPKIAVECVAAVNGVPIKLLATNSEFATTHEGRVSILEDQIDFKVTIQHANLGVTAEITRGQEVLHADGGMSATGLFQFWTQKGGSIMLPAFSLGVQCTKK